MEADVISLTLGIGGRRGRGDECHRHLPKAVGYHHRMMVATTQAYGSRGTRREQFERSVDRFRTVGIALTTVRRNNLTCA